MAQFMMADVPGAVNRGLQFKQQQELRPLEIAQAQQAIEAGEQRGQFSRLQQTNLQQQIDKRTDEEKNKSLLNTALRVSTASDADMIPILEQNIKRVQDLGGSADESIRALELAKSGDFDGVRTAANKLIEIGVRQGDINPLKTSTDNLPSSHNEFKSLIEIAQNPNSSPLEVKSARRALGDLAKVGTLSTDERVAGNPELQALITDYLANKAKETTSAIEDVKTKETGTRKAVAVAVDFAKSANDKIAPLNNLNAQYQSAIEQLDAGAETGVIDQLLPSINNSNLILDNIASTAGFDLAKSGGGIITDADMRWGLKTAILQGLPPDELKSFLTKKQAAQSKIIKHLQEVTTYLGDGTKTLSDWYNRDKETGGLTKDEQAELEQLRAELGQ